MKTIKQPIVIATHVSDIFGPAHALKSHLKKNADFMLSISFPLSKEDTNKPGYEVYKNGVLVETHSSKFSMPIFFANYIKDVFLTIVWSRRVLKKYNPALKKEAIFFGCNNLLSISGLFLRAFRTVKVSIFYAIDYASDRFGNKFLNGIYQWVDKTAAKNSDFVLSNTTRTQAIRSKQGTKPERNILMPNGTYVIEKDELTPIRENPGNVLRIEYHGYLSIGKGLQYIIKAMPLLQIPATLDVIGYGPYEQELQGMVEELNLQNKVKFHGKRKNEEILQDLHNFDICVNMISSKEDYLRFCDPLKIKEALGNGVPVLTSSVPEVSELIDKNKLGIVVTNPEDPVEIAEKINMIAQNPDIILELRHNVEEHQNQFSWQYIIDTALTNMNITANE